MKNFLFTSVQGIKKLIMSHFGNGFDCIWDNFARDYNQLQLRRGFWLLRKWKNQFAIWLKYSM